MKRHLTTLFFLITTLCAGLQAQEVWPGDVNNNGTVNGVDVLYWGMAFNAAGPSRTEPSEEWQAFPLPAPWSQNFPNGLNYAYADCNGDGIVDEDDFDKAIRDNYGQIHGSLSSEGFSNASANASAPKIILETNTPVVAPGALVDISFALAPSTPSIENFYGIAFSIKYDTGLLEGDDGPDFDLVENNWIEGDASYVQELYVDNKGDGTAMLAITRTNQQAIPIEQTTIGNFSIVIEDIILGLERDTTFILEIDSVRLISDQFQTIPAITNKIGIRVTTDTTSVQDTSSTVVSANEQPAGDANDIGLYPNPVTNEFFIQARSPIDQISLYDQLGRRIPFEYKKIAHHLYRIQCSEFPAGIYWVQMRQNEQIFTKKIIHVNKN